MHLTLSVACDGHQKRPRCASTFAVTVDNLGQAADQLAEAALRYKWSILPVQTKQGVRLHTLCASCHAALLMQTGRELGSPT